MATCAKCGAVSPDNSQVCPSCGAPFAAGSATPGNPTPAASGQGLAPNVAALLSYILWPVICLLFLILDPYNKNKFIRFHAFQALFLGLAAIAIGIVLMITTAILGMIPVLGWILDALIWIGFGLGMLGLVIYLMYRAYNGDRFMLPFIGNLAVQQSEKLA